MHLAIDASLTSTGLAFRDDTTKVISWKRVFFEEPIGGAISDTYKRVGMMTCGVMEAIMEHRSVINSEGLRVLIELPPPRGIYSPGLYMLFGRLVHAICSAFPYMVVIDGTSAMSIKSLLGSRKAKKSEAVEKAKQVLSSLGVSYDRIQSDEADALLLLFLYLRGEERYASQFDKQRIVVPRIQPVVQGIFKGV